MELEIKDYDAAGYYDYEELDRLRYDGEVEFHFLLTLTIGTKNQDKGNLFSILISTPNDECLNYRENKKRLYLVKYGEDWSNIYSNINNLVIQCSANTWYEAVGNLRKVFSWEYEGMKLNGVDLYQ